MSAHLPDETVAACAGCGQHRLSRKYRGLYLCLAGAWKCWRHRKAIYANHRDDERRSQFDEGRPV